MNMLSECEAMKNPGAYKLDDGSVVVNTENGVLFLHFGRVSISQVSERELQDIAMSQDE